MKIEKKFNSQKPMSHYLGQGRQAQGKPVDDLLRISVTLTLMKVRWL